LRKFLSSLAQLEEKPDHILWSEKTYGQAYEHLECLQNQEFSVDQINFYFQEKALELTGINYKTYTFSLSSSTRSDDFDHLVLDILSSNIDQIKLILTSNFDFGTVCALPASQHSDRIILGFALKN
jgi:hypothetical protein